MESFVTLTVMETEQLQYNRDLVVVAWNFTQPSFAPRRPRQPPVALLLDLEKVHGKFGDANYYTDGMHSEKTDKLMFFFI
jgi:hypothetical protein